MAIRAKTARWKQVLTWLTTLALLGYVFHAVPISTTLDAMRAAGAPAVVGLTAAYFLYSFAADVLATWATFGWFCAKLKLWDVVCIRGATYLLAIVNYNLGQAGIVYIVGRKHNTTITRATGTVLLTMGVMFVGLLVLAAVGSWTSDASDPRMLLMRWITAGGLGAFVLYLGVVAWRPSFFARWSLLQPLFDAGIKGHAKAFFVRLPHIIGHVVFQWLLLRAFGVDITLGQAATLLPLIFVIAWIPLTVQGLGTQQVAAMELLGPYGTASTTDGMNAQVVAFTLALTAAFLVYSLATGLLFLRTQMMHDIKVAERESNSDAAAVEGAE